MQETDSKWRPFKEVNDHRIIKEINEVVLVKHGMKLEVAGEDNRHNRYVFKICNIERSNKR